MISKREWTYWTSCSLYHCPIAQASVGNLRECSQSALHKHWTFENECPPQVFCAQTLFNFLKPAGPRSARWLGAFAPAWGTDRLTKLKIDNSDPTDLFWKLYGSPWKIQSVGMSEKPSSLPNLCLEAGHQHCGYQSQKSSEVVAWVWLRLLRLLCPWHVVSNNFERFWLVRRCSPALFWKRLHERIERVKKSSHSSCKLSFSAHTAGDVLGRPRGALYATLCTVCCFICSRMTLLIFI